jgi:DNA-binding GntR family transcriptional regulator
MLSRTLPSRRVLAIPFDLRWERGQTVSNTSFVNQKGSHTAERVAAEIRRAIRHQELLPGEHVLQGWWAERVGVSSAPTREALKMLVSEQLLTYDAHRGYFVARIDTNEMSQIYRLRRLLETEVLDSIRWPDEQELKSIRAAMDEVIECVKIGDGHGALDAARKVSFYIFDLSPLDLIVHETKRYWDRAAVYRALELASVEDPDAQGVTAFYAAYMSALESGDRERLIAINSEQRTSIPLRFENR